MLRAGVDPGLLDEVTWWRSDDLWYWSLGAFVTSLRVAAERTHRPLDTICRQLAERHQISLADSHN